MKKKYSIGFLIGIVAMASFLVYAYQASYNRALEENQQKQEQTIQTEGTAEKEEGYIIKEKDGYVIVYDASDGEVYEHTSIECKNLPEAVQKEVRAGKKVETIGQVYGFLENYSS